MRAKTPLIWLILIIGILCFWQLALIETPLVVNFWRNPDAGFRDFMAQSFYEGDAFGGSDIGVTLGIICFFIWVLYKVSGKSSRFINHKELKYIWLSSLISGLVIVHSLKWFVSRARPKEALPNILSQEISLEQLANITWPGFMAWDGPRGPGWNSFPSGHTASCAIMLVFAYIAWPRSRASSITLFMLIAGYCFLMAIARSMAGMHWLSDSVASFFLTWAVIHFMAIRMKILEPQ